MKLIKNILLVIWTLPQSIVGLFVYLINKKYIISKNIYTIEFLFGITAETTQYICGEIRLPNMGLGWVSFAKQTEPIETRQEELGHCVQSFWFSWLYIIIFIPPIGLIPLLHMWAEQIGKKYIT